MIIPIYNGERYISRCLLSLQQQTCVDWEAICVNDGSQDASERILLEYAGKDSRIKIVPQKNQGVVKARNVGIEHAQGEYICFLDIDDTLSAKAFELMLQEFDKNPNADIVVSGFNFVVKGKIRRRFTPDFSLLSGLEYLQRVLTGKNGWELCAKLYRKRLFVESLKLPQRIRVGEDAAVFVQLVSRAKLVAGCHVSLYNYIQYAESVSHRKSLQLASETLEAGCFIEEYLKSAGLYEKLKSEVDAMFLLFYSNSSRKGYLGKKHLLVQKIKREHWHFRAFALIPFYKAAYVFLYYYLGR